jgi:NADPH:quinone reductase-like Zn-dependent oxidoreductase
MTGLPYPIRLAGYGLRVPQEPRVGCGSGWRRGGDREVRDEVFGVGKGSFGEYARVLESKLALKPANLTFEQAAVVPISGRTAQQGVRDHGRVQAGQRVLITGASGGVGTYIVQLVKAFGAEVTAECSTTKLDLVRSLGADHVVDYTHEDFAAGGRSTTSFSISAVTRRCLGYGPR